MSKKKTFIPKEFLEKYSELMKEEKDKFFEYCKIKIPKSLWVNSQKIATFALKEKLEKEGWKLKEIAFHENAFDIIAGPVKPGQHPDFKEGLFNLQEKSSMLPAIILNPNEDDLVLDCCAAPGNKTLQLNNINLGHEKLIACEKDKKRWLSLNHNMKKYSLFNIETKLIDFLKFKSEKKFDRILLDAPCSSEGLVRKDFDALKNWSQKLVEKKAKEQKKLLLHAFDLLKPGGLIVYSTCSLSPEENEEVVRALLEKNHNAAIEEIKIKDFKTRNGLTEYNMKKMNGSLKNCARIYPQDNNSQAFFIAKIRKKK